MAFRPFNTSSSLPDSPDKLFLQLSRRKLPSVLPHQQSIMQSYVSQCLDVRDVAFQLPTGSGKTLVGLLIAEWRRRKFNERVVYLCPTKQLVNQVAAEAINKYGISVAAFTGSKRNYDPTQSAAYLSAERIAVTNYSSLFNSAPFFEDPDIIILDDAHTSENFIPSMWSVTIDRRTEALSSLFDNIVSLIRPALDPGNYARLSSLEENPADAAWVDKIPCPIFATYIDELKTIIDKHFEGEHVNYSWLSIRENLHACQIYLSTSSILIRPLIPPTWDHPPFQNAKQRIYMSATLGLGGDLERLTGRSSIKRLPTPNGFEMQGVGRRFFLFPESALERENALELCAALMKAAGRSIVLAPSDYALRPFQELVVDKLKYPMFTAKDIEASKAAFLEKKRGVILVANRYDGIDFPHDECRLLIIEGLPKTTNLQERFLVSRMGANVLLADRIKTRIVQAVGRCTRSLEDYSAVIALGSGLPDYLLSPKNQKHLHPALQSEIRFGAEQSRELQQSDFLELFDAFLKHDAEWEVAEQQIVDAQLQLKEEEFPCLSELANSAAHEIRWQQKLWQSDFEEALASVEKILGCLSSPELKGYRALWNYLAGSCAHLAGEQGSSSLKIKARGYFTAAKNAAGGIPWLVDLSRFKLTEDQVTQGTNNTVLKQVENIAAVIESLGIYHDKKLASKEKEILDGLKQSKQFENAHRRLGELLGFSTGKIESEGSPDPWWIVGNQCFVFEDYVGAEAESALSVTKARQVESHPNWMKANVTETADAEIIPVLVSHIDKVKSAALPHLNMTCFWNTSELKLVANVAISVIRELRTTFTNGDDLEWRARAVELLEEKKLDVLSLTKMFKASPASKVLKAVP